MSIAVIPAAESSLPARHDADFDLARRPYGSRAWRDQESCGAEESTNSWPTPRSSKVLRDTIGERFLFDQKRPLFVNEFVCVIHVHEHKSSLQKFASVNCMLRILSL
jgi:hypothetical protein